MARYYNGELTGLLGELVICRTKKGPVLRRRPQRTKPPTQRELESRHVFGLVNKWLQPVADFVKLGFRGYKENYEGRQAAVSVMYKNGLVASGYDSLIHPDQVLLSWGDLGLPEEMTVNLDGELVLGFAWSTELAADKDRRDRAMLLAYNCHAGVANWKLHGPAREAGAASLSLKNMAAGTYHVYLAFAGVDGKGQSRSAYLGEVLV